MTGSGEDFAGSLPRPAAGRVDTARGDGNFDILSCCFSLGVSSNLVCDGSFFRGVNC